MQGKKRPKVEVPQDFVSIRKYAALKKVVESNIRYHIRQGRLDGCIDYTNPDRPLINVAMADAALERYLNPMYERQQDMAAIDKGSATPPGQRSLAEVKRVTAEIEMQRRALLLRKEKGQLLDKDEVYKSLFAAGQELRQTFTSLADRCIDDILAAPSRKDAHAVLSEAVAQSLEKFTEIQSRELSSR